MTMASNSIHNHLNDPGRLAALHAVALLDTPTEEAFDRLSRLAARFTSSPVALVSLVDSDRQFFKSCIGLPEPWNRSRETPLSHSFCQHNRVAGRPLVIPDARENPLFKDNLAVRDLDVIAYLGIPLMTSDSYVLGSFCVIDTKPRSWTDTEVETLRDLAGAVMTEIELRTEIEKRRQSEEARRESEFRYQSIVEHIPQKIFTKGLDGVYLSCNRAYADDLGIEPGDISGKDDFMFYPRELAEKYRADDRRIMTAGQSEDLEEQYFARGEEKWVRTTKVPLIWGDNQVHGILGIFEDITERRLAEQRLRESEERFKAIFDDANDGILVGNTVTKKFVMANNMICCMLGYTRDEILNMSVPDIHPKEELPSILESFDRQANKEFKIAENLPVKRKDGTIFYADINTSPITIGIKTYLIGIFRDITERKLAQEKIKASLKEKVILLK